jgi:hypothetical protein
VAKSPGAHTQRPGTTSASRGLVACAAFALFSIGGCSKKQPEKAPAAVTTPSPSEAESPAASATVAESPAPATEAELIGGALPASKPITDEPPEVAAITARIIHGDHSTKIVKELQKLSHKYPRNAEVFYILGQLYCDKLWMGDGLQALGKALELEPLFRTNPYVIRAVIKGLANDGDHLKVERFLIDRIGKPAVPFLEEVIDSGVRQQVKDRAASTIAEIHQ